jgi:hypothetical protein
VLLFLLISDPVKKKNIPCKKNQLMAELNLLSARLSKSLKNSLGNKMKISASISFLTYKIYLCDAILVKG